MEYHVSSAETVNYKSISAVSLSTVVISLARLQFVVLFFFVKLWNFFYNFESILKTFKLRKSKKDQKDLK